MNKVAATIAGDNLQLLLVNDNNNENNITITPRDDE